MIAVIGCGNTNRRDDGVGSAVIRGLAARGAARDGEVTLLDAGTDGLAVMFAARGCRRLILVDACRSGSAPGAIFEIPGAELEAPNPPSLSTHDFRWEHALHAGRRIFGDAFPKDVTVLLIEAADIGFGLDLTPAVAAAAAKVADRIAALAATPAEPAA
ncbi:MAG TPA: hydrogenase maturation protease [Stellaceae bacterium]|nr:hydrogenase maturation protease [Stellaceae bacterium]